MLHISEIGYPLKCFEYIHKTIYSKYIHLHAYTRGKSVCVHGSQARMTFSIIYHKLTFKLSDSVKGEIRQKYKKIKTLRKLIKKFVGTNSKNVQQKNFLIFNLSL